MQSLGPSAWRGGQLSSFRYKPTAVSAVCPYCGERGVFTCSGHQESGPINSVSCTGRCPGCKGQVGIWTVNPNSETSFDKVQIFIYPPAKLKFSHPPESESIPPSIRRALIAAIDSYNFGIYPGTAAAARRALEGMFKYLAPEADDKTPLHDLIETVKKNPTLAEPLTNLSHLVRAGGNLGAHFNLEREPSEALARHMVELVDYFFAYLYVLPTKIKELEAELLTLLNKGGN